MANVELDLFIQDFVTTNKLMNQHCDWPTLSSRRFQEDGLKKVFTFESGGSTHMAIGTQIALPDSDWFRIELTHALSESAEYRFDYLRMMHTNTHVSLTVEPATNALLVKLTTRHRGLMNVVFVIRDGLPLVNPFLV